MSEKTLAGIRVLMVIAPEDFRDEELLEPKQILTDAGAKVTVASTRAGAASGMLGASVNPDVVVDTIKPGDYHAVVVVGGMGSPTHLWNHTKLHELLQHAAGNGGVAGGICLSGAVLAKAGILNGKRATVWAMDESLKALEEGKAQYTAEHVVADGNVITADGPEAATDFGHALVVALQKNVARV